MVDVLGGNVVRPMKLLMVFQFSECEFYVFCKVQIVFEPERLKSFNSVTDESREHHVRNLAKS